jgi:hypothetical protein
LIFAVIVSLVCIAVGLVVYIVCAAFTIIELVFCLLWTVVSIIFCLSKANGGTAFLLTDGTIMVQEFTSLGPLIYGTHRWWKLTPDASGSYAGGSWTRLADSNVARSAFASAVLADGRVIVCGGEYSDTSLIIKADRTNSCEIYDPVANTWSKFASPTDSESPPKVWDEVGDAPGTLLPDGSFLMGSIDSRHVAKLDPVGLTWAAMHERPPGSGSATEESWVLMPDNTVATPSCLHPSDNWVYDVVANQWNKGNSLPQTIIDTGDNEIGPGLLRYDGTAFFVGSTEHTANYSPSAAPPWANGPDLPAQGGSSISVHDGPGAVLVNGNILFCAGEKKGDSVSSPCWYFEYDGAGFQRTNDPPNHDRDTEDARLLLLPNGDVMVSSDTDSSFYAYHSDSAVPDDSYRPVIQHCPTTINPGTTIQISGLQFNGLSQAVGYGDDSQTATNYPLVRIVNNQSHGVRYCRTFNHTTVDGNGNTIPSMGVATGAAVITTNVAIPSDIELGNSSLYVVANGIPSQPFDLYVSDLF